MMQNLNLTMPTHITEALRTNMTGGKTVAQMLSEAAAIVPFMSPGELNARMESGRDDLIVLDVRESEAFEEGQIEGARLLPRGQLELRVNQECDYQNAYRATCRKQFGRTVEWHQFPMAISF